MNLIEESFQKKEEKKKKTLTTVILIAIILIVLIIIGIVSYLAYIQKSKLHAKKRRCGKIDRQKVAGPRNRGFSSRAPFGGMACAGGF